MKTYVILNLATSEIELLTAQLPWALPFTAMGSE